MSPGDIRWAQSEAARVSAKYTTTSIADNLETLNDIGAAVHDRGGQSQLMELLAKRQQLAVGQGQDAKQVRDSNARLVKTLEMAGALVDSHGQFNAAKTSAMMEMIQGVESIEGRNINANQIQMATKYLKENALTQSVDNLRNVLFLGAEMSGSTAGNSLTSVINGFTGRSPKEVLANLIRNGLATGNIDAKGKVSNYELKDEQLLRSDFGGWLSKMIGPILEQKGIDAKQSPVELAKFLRTITGRTTQQDILMKWFTQAMENANKSAAAENVRQDEETARGVVNRDYNAAFVAMTKQAESAFGEIGDKIKGLVIPGLTTTRSLFTDITKALSPDATDADRRGLVKAGVGTAAGGALAAWGGAKLLGLFNPLTGAATALTSSATALDASAAALMRAAGVGVVGTGAGAAGAAATAGTKTVAATVAAAAVPVTAAAVASALGAAAVGGVTYGLVRAGVIDATKKQGTAAWTKAHPGGSGRQDRPNDEWFRGKRRETEQTKKAADEVENLKKRLHDFRGSLSNDETGNIIGRIDRIISAMSAANRAAIRNFGAPARAANGQLPYGAAGAGAPVGTAGWNSTIPQHAFSAGTFEETLKQFSTAFQSTISGLHTSTAEFEAAGRAVHADISSGADDLKAKAGDLSGGWKSDLTAGGASIATQIRSALQTPVTVNVQQSAGPNIGNVGPVRQ
ncbi:hypothetical protein [Methylosinus sp. H3A]|uniref:hypothetical protein n=1 Tax=Methylosinus sp. H3A TaxID=2785786 RepID=UPI001AED7F3E|nr:hypothetical protein [Methylosinus sp. H3A]